MSEIKLIEQVELKTILKTQKDVEMEFKLRGYKFNKFKSKNGFHIRCSIKNIENEIINYEFDSISEEKCYLQAALFLKKVEIIREEYGLPF